MYLRDTILLTPPIKGSRSLSAVGSMYSDDFHKIKISHEDLHDMKSFLFRDFSKFKQYALRDSVVTLIHASFIEDFCFKIEYIGVPLTLTTISAN